MAIEDRSMRIVAIADTHTFHDELVVPAGDVLICAGDLCRRGDLEELRRGLDWLRGQPHRAKILVAGNHDWAFAEHPDAALAACGSEIRYLQDEGVTIDGVRLWGSPWQPTFNDWAFNLPRGEPLARRWSLIPEGTDVLITHGPPSGIGDRSSTGGRQGCADLLLRTAQIRPRLHLFGHIHDDGGLWRRDGLVYANVTTWECERGATVIDLATDGSGRVEPVSVPPRSR